MNLCTEFDWRELGEIRAEGGRLRFPIAPELPGVYRFRLTRQTGERHYIGETELLRRRFQHYRTPGPSQRTNLRINTLLVELLAHGGRAEVAVITDATLHLDDEAIEADFAHRPYRLLVENAALVATSKAGIMIGIMIRIAEARARPDLSNDGSESDKLLTVDIIAGNERVACAGWPWLWHFLSAQPPAVGTDEPKKPSRSRRQRPLLNPRRPLPREPQPKLRQPVPDRIY